MNPSTPTDKEDRAVPRWFVLIQCNRISTTQKCLASQEQQGLAPETLQVGSHGKNRNGKLQQNYSTRIKKELLDKPPTGPQFQRSFAP